MTKYKLNYPIPPAHPFVQFFFQELNRQQRTAVSVAGEAGLALDISYKWKHHTPKLQNLQAALNVLGFDLQIVEKKK